MCSVNAEPYIVDYLRLNAVENASKNGARPLNVNQYYYVTVYSWHCHMTYHRYGIIIYPRRACAERVTVVVSCVCVCIICLSAHAIPAVRAIISITKDAIVLSVRFAAILRWRFP